jgi:hypothetical protein
MIRSISMRFSVNPASERWCVARMYARSPRASRSSSGSPPTGDQRAWPAAGAPRDGQSSSHRVIMHIPRCDRNASCSLRPMSDAVDKPRSEMSMRREGIVTPRSYASVATMANSCAANRDPRRSARNVTCNRASRSSSAGAASSPAPSKAAAGAGAARGDAPRARPGARGHRTGARNARADDAAVAHDIVVARRIMARSCDRNKFFSSRSRNRTDAHSVCHEVCFSTAAGAFAKGLPRSLERVREVLHRHHRDQERDTF